MLISNTIVKHNHADTRTRFHQQSAPWPVLHKVAVEDGIGAEAQLLVEAEAHVLNHVVDVEDAARGLPQLLLSTLVREYT